MAIKIKHAYGFWCDICAGKRGRRKLVHIDRQREKRAWKKEEWK